MSQGEAPAGRRPSAARALARRYLRGLLDEPSVVVCGACAFLVISHHQGSTDWFSSHYGRAFANHPAARALPFFWWFGTSLLLYMGLPLLLSLVTRGSFHRRYGLSLGDWRAGLPLTLALFAVMLPALFVAQHLASFRGQYPLAGQPAFTLSLPGNVSKVSLPLFAAYEAAYFAYFVGWEFLFRGWMLNAMLARFGRLPALLTQTAPFVIMHLGKPELEALGSIPAGLALGLLALRTRSFWYGALLHGAVAVSMDVFSAWSYLLRA